MKKKFESDHSEIPLTVSENLLKDMLDDVVEGVGVDILKAVPFVPAFLAVREAISNFKDARYHRNLIAFFYESKENEKFSRDFFNNKSNAEIGLEILSLVEQTYLEHQAQMIARITRMWKETQMLNKEEFDEYASIILSFDSHLIRQFEQYMTYKGPVDQNNKAISIGPDGIDSAKAQPEMFLYPNMIFVSHGFLRQREIKNVLMGGSFAKEGSYSITKKAHFFYENIFKKI